MNYNTELESIKNVKRKKTKIIKLKEWLAENKNNDGNCETFIPHPASVLYVSCLSFRRLIES